MKFGTNTIRNDDLKGCSNDSRTIEVTVEVTRIKGNQIGAITIIQAEYELPAFGGWATLYKNDWENYSVVPYNTALKLVESYIEENNVEFEGQVQ